MIPLSLVTGFLGSGKTTLLRRIAARETRRLVFLVNELSSVDVDGRLIDVEAERLTTVAGGSIFCRCLVTEFIDRLKDIGAMTPTPEGVVIEASGVADPRVVGRLLAETGLDERFALRQVVAIVDPGTFADLLETLPNIRSQVQACDLALINKIDLYDEETLREVEASLRAINAQAALRRARHCDATFDLFASAPAHDVAGELAGCADPNYAVYSVDIPGTVDVERFRRAWASLGDAGLRAKGFVRSSDGERVLLEAVGKRVSATPVGGSDGDDSRLQIIVRGGRQEQLLPLIRQARSGGLAG